MILGYNSMLGYAPLQAVQSIPIPSTYTGLKVYGECVIDNIHVINRVLTDTEISAIDYNIKPQWIVGETLFLATFDEENLNGGNVEGLLTPITSWSVFRKKVGDSKFTLLQKDIPADSLFYLDPTAYSRETFQYEIFPIASTVQGSPMLVNPLEVELDSWYLLSLDGLVSHRMCANFTNTPLNYNTENAQKQTMGKFDVFNKSNRNFVSASISFIPNFGTETNGHSITQTEELVQELRAFIENGETKILKSPKGGVWKVNTSNASLSQVIQNNREQLYYMDFDFAEIEEME